MNNSIINQENYQKFRDKNNDSIILRKETALANVRIIDDEYIDLQGVKIKMAPDAFKQLVKYIGLSPLILKNLDNTLGERTRQALLDEMRKKLAMGNNKSNIVLLLNPNTKVIVGFAGSIQGTLSNNAFFNLFEDVVNKHTGMVIKNMSVSPNGTVEISVINKNWEFEINKLSDEVFNTGLTFIQTPTETIICPFNERLTCTNGMVVSHKGTSIILTHTDSNSINGFFDAVRSIKDMTYFESEFKKRALVHMATTSSYAELRSVRSTLEYYIDSNDPMNKVILEKWVPSDLVTREYLRHGLDLIQNRGDLWKRVRTNTTVWELINALTDLASHPEREGVTFTFAEKRDCVFQLQKTAGELFMKDPLDLEWESKIPKLF